MFDIEICPSFETSHSHEATSGRPLLQWRHNDHDSVANHQPHGCLLNCMFRRRSKKTSKLCVTGLCGGNSPGPVNSPHKGPVTRKMFPFDDVIMMTSPSVQKGLGKSQPCCYFEKRVHALTIKTFKLYHADRIHKNIFAFSFLKLWWHNLLKYFPMSRIWYAYPTWSIQFSLINWWLNEHHGSLLLTWINFNPSMDN